MGDGKGICGLSSPRLFFLKHPSSPYNTSYFDKPHPTTPPSPPFPFRSTRDDARQSALYPARTCPARTPLTGIPRGDAERARAGAADTHRLQRCNILAWEGKGHSGHCRYFLLESDTSQVAILPVLECEGEVNQEKEQSAYN